MNIFFKLAQLIPDIGFLIGKIFLAIGRLTALINTRILPLISNKRLPERAAAWLFTRLYPIIEQRQQTPTSRVDVLQLMLQVMTDKEVYVDDNQETSKANYRLTRDEVFSNMIVFMAAGYETTSTALAYATYILAKHPEVLEKLQAEIDQLPLSDDDPSDEETKKYPDYDVVAQMPYMDMFITEVLRMYPIANNVVERCASEDTVVQKLPIKKGKERCSSVIITFFFSRYPSACRCVFYSL